MKLIDYLFENDDDLFEREINVDKSFMELHQNNYYVVGDLSNIELEHGEITLNSFKNKLDYINSGYNTNGDKQNILELAVISLMAYNNYRIPITKELIMFVIQNYEKFLVNENIPEELKDYYRDVFSGNIKHLNEKLNETNELGGKGNSMTKVKSTSVGKALADKESAYVNVLLLPATLVLIYLVFMVTYFILKYI